MCIIKKKFICDNKSTLVATLLLTNDTHNYDTRMITHDTRAMTNLLNVNTQTITITHANKQFCTIKHAKSKIIFKIRNKETYCFNFYYNMLVFSFLFFVSFCFCFESGMYSSHALLYFVRVNNII